MQPITSTSKIIESVILAHLYGARTGGVVESLTVRKRVRDAFTAETRPTSCNVLYAQAVARFAKKGWFVYYTSKLDGRSFALKLTPAGIAAAKASRATPSAEFLRNLLVAEVSAAGVIDRLDLFKRISARFPQHPRAAMASSVRYAFSTAVGRGRLSFSVSTDEVSISDSSSSSVSAPISDFIPETATKHLPHIVGKAAEEHVASMVLPKLALTEVDVWDPLLLNEKALLPTAFAQQVVVDTPRPYGYANRTVDFFIGKCAALPKGLACELKFAQSRTTFAEVDTILFKDLIAGDHGLPTVILLDGDGYDGAEAKKAIAYLNKKFSYVPDFRGVFTVRDFVFQVQALGWKAFA